MEFLFYKIIIVYLLGMLIPHMVSTNSFLLQSVSGIVERGNFTYWSLNYNGNIKLILTTIQGDADLYVSEKLTMPSFEPEKYDLHSASCGEDLVDIPVSFNRPIGVGVYGHPFYENTSYTLEIFYNNEKTDNFIDYTSNEDGNEKILTVKEKLKKVALKSGFWLLLELFVELIFL